jgi:hypothetical protein
MGCGRVLPTWLVACVFLTMTASARELRHGDQVRLPDNAAGAEAAELGINCPTISDVLRPSSSIKCDGCHVIAIALVYRVVRKRQLLEEATDALCEDMMESTLRQKTNGRRFWVPPHKSKLGDTAMNEEDKLLETDRTMTLTGLDPRFGRTVTYHDEFEQRVLPCAPYLLKRMCFARLEEHDDAVEACFKTAKKKAPNAIVKPDSEGEETLLECVSNALGCHSDDCHERRVLKAREEERVRFLKFEGAYGNEKAPYVEDEFQSGLMMKNPYGPGGALEKKNDVRKKMLREKQGVTADDL